jgi:hypothetical protein
MEIMPVVRLYRPQQNPGTIGQRGREAVRRYVQAGAMYFETNNEPDLDLEWHIPRPDNWLDLVVQDFIADADIVLEEGGYPAMPAFGVGTQRDPFAKVVERGRRDILDGGAWAAIHLTLCRIISRLAHRQTAPTRGLNTPSVRSSLWTMTYLMARCAWRAKSLTHHSPGRNAMDGVIYPKAATVPFIRSSWSVLLPKPGYVTLPV